MISTRESISGAFRIRDVRYARGFTYTPHAHDDHQISVVLRGSIAEETRGRVQRGFAGDVIVKPSGTQHADEFDDARIVCIDFPAALPEIAVGAYAWHRYDEASSAAFRVARRFLGGEDVSDDITELLAALCERRLRDHAVAVRAADMLEESFAKPLRLADMAVELGFHSVYVARVFRQHWGCAPREYLQRVRVRAAAHRIASTSDPLATIACDTGFSDQAHMTRIVSRRLGLAPAALRRVARD